ncbi:hypothetical protein DXA22_00270 [Bifidobacterium pseudocatenulatum]|uniref:Uncharacterized protein n=1 Tax=Bifidobacterium pseudocatenulatum TaxID=28026 RepID=A0A413KE64_BIFPS|nr:hypothetical protein DXA22_00270 [Bifidobacterium pseudocatenulatum]
MKPIYERPYAENAPNILRFGLKSAFLKRMPFCLQRITTSATITLMVCAKIVPRAASAGPS